jgi:hypothetical protein
MAGAGVGIYAMVRGRRAAEALTADGLHDRWQALGVGARLFRDEVATGKADAETALRQRLGRAGLDTPSLAPRADYSPSEALTGREGYPAGDRNDDSIEKLEEGMQ